ncbi:hypothetical protein Scep_020627 [Stephania cephalantha]|uniref:Uncharacterized protein n=1 Tax=Stephania cephalantha TaxID=152367 RepID=A0AAP0NNC9_9MAGN
MKANSQDFSLQKCYCQGCMDKARKCIIKMTCCRRVVQVYFQPSSVKLRRSNEKRVILELEFAAPKVVSDTVILIGCDP